MVAYFSIKKSSQIEKSWKCGGWEKVALRAVWSLGTMGDMGDASGRVSELVYSGSSAKRCGKVGGAKKIWPVRVRWGAYKRRCGRGGR